MENQELSFKDLRREYSMRGLSEADLNPDPFEQFDAWFKEALAAKLIEPNAFFLSTATPEGKPSCRAVLMKHFSKEGLFFFTHYESRKAIELETNPYAAATFWWGVLERQIRLEGRVEKISREIAIHYFSQRPRKSQLAAWASSQGKPLSSKTILTENYTRFEQSYQNSEVPCPPFWGGYKIIPSVFEFWQGSEARLHDRFLYAKREENWSITRLSP